MVGSEDHINGFRNTTTPRLGIRCGNAKHGKKEQLWIDIIHRCLFANKTFLANGVKLCAEGVGSEGLIDPTFSNQTPCNGKVQPGSVWGSKGDNWAVARAGCPCSR